MKRYTFILFVCLLLACNSHNNAVNKKDSLNSALIPLVQNMKKQTEQFPDSAGIRLQYAYTLDSVGNYKDALIQMDTLVQRDSSNYGLYYAQGQIAEDAHDTTLALSSYSKAAHVYESPDVLLALANLYAEQKNDRAITLCSRVKALGLGRDYDANCAFIIGVYYARLHKRDEAIKYFNECIANSYTYMEAYIEKGLVYFDEEQYDKALSIFQFASTVNNLYADAYYYQARCYEMMNKKDSAVLNFKQSLEIDPTMNEARIHLKDLGEE